ncbi:MAG: radical SAM protein [Deltaproteobacteria bacterium]|nr:radical SAM protein [Deltaproteobacteria bacterium]
MSAPAPLAAPTTVLWEITRACNLRCRHCLTRSGRPAPDELSTGEALRVCDELAELGVRAVALMGGEPLVRPDWAELAARLHARGVAPGLVTNGLLLDNDALDRALAAGVNQVVVGLDGDERAHEAIRGRRTFGRALDAVVRAGRAGVRHRMVVTSVHRENAAALPALRELLLERAPGITWALNFTSIPEGSRMDRALRADAELFRRTVEFVVESRQRSRGRIEVTGSHDMGYCSTRFGELSGGPWRGCPAGLETLGIGASGAIKGCLTLPDRLAEANVRDRPLADVWRDPQAFHYARRFRLADLRGACAGCEHGALCRGGCLEVSLERSGEPHHAPFCLHRMERDG